MPTEPLLTAGYVLAGGRSSRMGVNKALLPWRGATLLEHIALEVEAAAGSVSIVGGEPHGRFRWIADEHPGLGPLSGIETALADSAASWNLIVACDMPGVSREWLRRLLDEAEGDATVPESTDGRLHPLCAAWNRSALGPVRAALASRVHTVTAVVRTLRFGTVAVDDGAVANVNTPSEWASFAGRQG